MNRYLFPHILNDLKKMVFITGPRQVGKTYLAKQIMTEFKTPQYLNHDNIDDRKIIQNRAWKLNADLVVFDEIHKMKDWKIFLKGIYDTRPSDQSILVTGSSRLETYRQSGESLAGRYFHLRLNPVSVKELDGLETPYDAVEKLNRLGGFPEPFLSGSEEESTRWRNQYYTDLVREDIMEFSRINEIRTMRILVELLRQRVGSPLSYRSLAEDLQSAPNTIKKYIQILESLYVIFLVRPYHKNIARSIMREPKLYFYDSAFVQGNDGIRFENTCAVCLLKYVQFLYDVRGQNVNLHYIRTKDGKEIDFAISVNDGLEKLIEVKLADTAPSKNLSLFAGRFPAAEPIQLVHNLRQEKHMAGINILRAGEWLSGLPC